MKLFKPLYERALRWAKHPHAERYLGGLSFVEAIIFPVAPEIMLAPMVLAQPQRWARYASVSLLGSMLGAWMMTAAGSTDGFQREPWKSRPRLLRFCAAPAIFAPVSACTTS